MLTKQHIVSSVVMVGILLTLPLLAQGINDNLHIHGFAGQGYIKTTGNNHLVSNSKDGSSAVTEVAINFITYPANRVKIGAQIYSRDLGEEGNLFFTLDWGYGDYRWQDYLGIRVGRVKQPRGLYNKVRDIDMARILIYLPQGIYDEFTRELVMALDGASLYGNVPIPVIGGVDYEVFGGCYNISSPYVGFSKSGQIQVGEKLAHGMMAKPGTLSADFTGATDASLQIENVFGFHINWETPVSGLRFAGDIDKLLLNNDFTANIRIVSQAPDPNQTVSATSAMPVSTTGNLTAKIVSCEYKWNNLTLAGEYLARTMENAVTIAGKGGDPIEFTRESYWTMGSYQVTDWLALSSYYSVFYKDKNDKEGADQVAVGRPAYHAWQKDLCFTTRFDLTENWLIKVEYHSINGTAQTPVLFNQGNELVEDWSLFTLKSTFHF